jgi:formylglycine-generating enzyme required for sulfatase activity
MMRFIISSMSIAGMILAMLVATSVQSSRADVIQACVNKIFGTVRIVSGPSKCLRSETPLSLQGTSCAPDAVQVGPICVDKYEASVWSSPTGGTQFGTTSANYPCSLNGNDCSAGAAHPIFARSVAGVTPSAFITWFQAEQACANVGKRLLRNGEWQMAAAGTPDPGTDNGTTDCNISATGTVVATGSRSNCISNYGVFDMVGNLDEWVEDWVPQSTTCVPSLFADDFNCLAGASTTSGPGALIRGGDFVSGTLAGVFRLTAFEPPSDSDSLVGFRCAR